MKKLWILAACAAMFATACSNDDNEPISGGVEDRRAIVIDPVLMKMDHTSDTRATDVDFEKGDAIGLNIQMQADGSDFLSNQKMVFNGTEFKSESELLWYKDYGLKSNMVAYYPYAAALPTEFTVAADQSQEGAYTASDLIMGFKDGVTPTVASTVLPFKHMLTKLVVNVENKCGGVIKSVAFRGTVPTATVDFAQKSVAVKAEGAAQEIVAKKVAEQGTKSNYAAIVVPQNVKLQMAVTVQFRDVEKVFVQTYKQLDILNGQYTVQIDVLPDKIDVIFSGEIEDWTDNGTLTPDTTPDVPVAPEFEEFADHFVYHGETYAIKEFKDGRVWMTENLRYVPEGHKISTDPADPAGTIWAPYTSDGTNCTANTDPAFIKKQGLLYLHETAFGKEITPDNAASFEGTQGICPKGWHIPTHVEMVALVGKTNKNAAGEDLSDPNAAYYDKDYDGSRVTTLNEVGWNFIRSGVRQMTSTTATPAYQAIATDNQLNLTFYMSSTFYKAKFLKDDPTVYTNIQFFGMMSAFTGAYPEGKVSVAYNNLLTASPVRCIKNK